MRVFMNTLAGIAIGLWFITHAAVGQVEQPFASPTDTTGLRSQRPKLFAAVLFAAANNTVGMRKQMGVFVRAEGDTAWAVIPNSNTMAFGAGYSMDDRGRRYYVCGGNGLFRTDNDGTSWRMLTDWRTMEILSVAVDPSNAKTIYVCTPFGMFRSVDDGATWMESIRGMKKWFVQQLIIDRDDPSRLYAAGEEDVYVSTNRGDRWTPLHAGVKEVRAIFQHPRNRAILLAGTEDEGIRCSHDGGKTWFTGQGSEGGTFLAFAASSDGRSIFAGGFATGVWKSTDVGRSWRKISEALTTRAVYALFVHPEDPAHLFLGGEGAGLLESRDGGRTWTLAGLPGTHIKQIAMFP
jgi:photosystem II stability/assembly factor-like uncharacterized protein